MECACVKSPIANRVDRRLSNPREAPRRAPLYRQFLRWRQAQSLLRRADERLSNIWCIWSGAARSFVWHIRIQSATETPHVILGPAPLLSPEGLLLDQPGTRARAEGIRNLSAKYPWADIVHHQIFLMGFDAGERMCVHIPHTETDKQSASPS
jgi:hypothetical protein